MTIERLPMVDPGAVGLSASRLERVGGWLDEQVARERVAGASVLIGRRGHVAYAAAAGVAETSTGRPFDLDAIVRIYSMTKPITTVAAMMLYEQGAFHLGDPISKFIPSFSDPKVWPGGDAPLSAATPAPSPITVRQLMTHTSGLTYGFMNANPVDEAYRENDLDVPTSGVRLDAWAEKLSGVPLIAAPGAQWNYSVSTDLLGRLVEIWSGRTLDAVFDEEIFKPLRMTDAGFSVRPEALDRFAALYGPFEGGSLSAFGATATQESKAPPPGVKQLDPAGGESRFARPPAFLSGGGGLVGSIADYARFCQMLLNGGALDGVRLLSPKTVAFMRMNHLPDNRDMAAMGQPVWSETSYSGVGFGLGSAVMIDPAKAEILASPGEYHWGGAASTFFWIDPQEDLYVIFFTQLFPSSTYPFRRELRVRVYQALVD